MNRAERRRQKKTEKAAKNATAVQSRSPFSEQQTPIIQQALDLAVEHHTAGRLSEAERIYQEILQNNPNQPVALHLFGLIAHQVRENDKAVDLITKALAIKPDYAEAYSNLGLALQELGRLDDAAASYRKARHIRPDLPEVHYNLANTLRDLGKLEEATAAYREALVLKPELVEAHHGLGITFHELGRLDDAVSSFKKALAIKPDFSEALGSYGILLISLGRWDEAMLCFNRNLELVRGENPVNPSLDSFRFITKAKIKHDIDQFHYLESVGLGAGRMGELANVYAALDKEIEWPDEDGAPVPLTEKQLDLIRSSYNRPVHLIEAPEIPGSALTKDLDPKLITQNYMGNAPGMTHFDNFLKPEALHSLRQFLLESTIWYDFRYSEGYLGAVLRDGLACPLLFQIAEELRHTFPDIFKNHLLYQLWAYKYDSQLTGINVHADFAAVNVNFWITPNSANLSTNSGGLIVYKEEAPLDWNFKLYNQNRTKIREFLAKHDSGKMVVPYAENRVVLFNSDLFHETDTLEFKTGYENRRINVTMLFGNRWD